MSQDFSEAYGKALKAREASRILSCCARETRDTALEKMADALREHVTEIIDANRHDMGAARMAGTSDLLLDRLMLDEHRIDEMAYALSCIARQEDPIGTVLEERVLDNGIQLQKVSVPIGVVAIVYEARPNVTSDAIGLCIKSANAAILRGGSMARHTNLVITAILDEAACAAGIPEGAIQSIEDVSHAATEELMSLHGIVDVLIPRGGAGLIRSCVENSKVPVIETGTGNCHIYLHEAADQRKAVDICLNAKVQRPSVCNAAESLLVDDSVADMLLPPVLKALSDAGVLLHCDDRSLVIARSSGITTAMEAEEGDWGREYLAMEMSVRCVQGLDQAVAHIDRYGTGHSEAIVSEDQDACDRFLARVDAAAVYANASTRFTDGGQFGLGAEIGISTQKLHVRGPMGVGALCSMKYQLRGTGQVR